MLKRSLGAVVAIFLFAFARPVQAATPVAMTTADLNLRAGPGVRFPVVATIPDGANVRIYGCIDAYSWCDVGWGGDRGWVAGAYLQVVYLGRPVVVTAVVAPRIGIHVIVFDHGYWVRHYATRPWYRSWRVYW